MSGQLSIPVPLSLAEVTREKSLGGSIVLCARAGGFSYDKVLANALTVNQAQLSRWQSGGEGIIWPKLQSLMDTCGNDAPVLWMLHQRNYDLSSLRHTESETERQNRLLREENAALKRVLIGSGG